MRLSVWVYSVFTRGRALSLRIIFKLLVSAWTTCIIFIQAIFLANFVGLQFSFGPSFFMLSLQLKPFTMKLCFFIVCSSFAWFASTAATIKATAYGDKDHAAQNRYHNHPHIARHCTVIKISPVYWFTSFGENPIFLYTFFSGLTPKTFCLIII